MALKKEKDTGERLALCTPTSNGSLSVPQPPTAGFTLEQKQEHEVAWKGHGGLGSEGIWPKTVVQRSLQNGRGEREVARTDVTRLVTILPTSCVWVYVCP